MLDDHAIRYKQHDLVEAQGRSTANTLVGEFGDFRYSAHITRSLIPRFAFGALVTDAGGADGRSRLIGQR